MTEPARDVERTDMTALHHDITLDPDSFDDLDVREDEQLDLRDRQACVESPACPPSSSTSPRLSTALSVPSASCSSASGRLAPSSTTRSPLSNSPP